MLLFRRRSPPHGGYFDLEKRKTDIAALEADMNAPGFWQDSEQAQRVSAKHAALAKELGAWDALRRETDDLAALAVDGDESLREEITASLADAEKRYGKLEFTVLFSGSHDSANVIMAFHAGTGGTEAMDWSAMLLRMVLRYCERKGFRARIIDEHRGAEAGIKSATVSIEGPYAYGTLKSEHGVHRLVRISPFDAEKMRHTSFALIEVMPELGDVEEVPIESKDIRVDTYLSSGHGGQSVQTTYSAVRITHLPTGIVVTCQNERSQQQNRETAMKILRAKLAALADLEREKEKQELRGAYTSAEWGNQIRSYVLQPYQMVKDHRTGHQTSDTDGVLDGDIDAFIEAYLRWIKEGRPNRKTAAKDEL
ncbi:peptide chain release factor 2 [Patescibacteria group bacterium]|nr:MAG: peptide chain release factor 2 [Patescibacteria group bacterium]